MTLGPDPVIDLEQLKIDPTESFEDVNDLLYRVGVTDGLPVVPPTPGRVATMLGGREAEQVLTTLPPLRGRATMRKLAMCAVMAGCRPAYFPIVLAATAAVAQPAFNLFGIQTTTGTATPLIIVNGPVVQQCGLNAAANALGPGVHSNATIGRALGLILRNVGGAIPGYTDKATMGQPGKYTFCCAENEAANPWEALHVSRGYQPWQSTVTVVGAAGTVEVVDSTSHSADSLLTTLARSMTIAGSLGGGNYLGGGEPLLLLAPEHAAIISRDYTRHQAQQALFARARLPLSVFPPETVAHVQQLRGASAKAQAEVGVAARPEDILLVVVGAAGAKSTYVPTWGGTTRAVTQLIDLG
jgi:hypothetical protein